MRGYIITLDKEGTTRIQSPSLDIVARVKSKNARNLVSAVESDTSSDEEDEHDRHEKHIQARPRVVVDQHKFKEPVPVISREKSITIERSAVLDNLDTETADLLG